MREVARNVLVTMLALLVGTVAHAQAPDQAPSTEPPTAVEAVEEPVVDARAQAILARAVEAIGGDAQRRSLTSTRSVARFEMPGSESRFELLTRSPDLFLVRHRIKNLGTMELGFDGTHGWRKDPPDDALNQVDADDAADFARRFDLQALIRELDLRFSDAHMGESATFEDVECDVVHMRNGTQDVNVYFDQSTGLPKLVEVREATVKARGRRVVVESWSKERTPLLWVREFRIEQPRGSFRAIYDSVTFDDVSESTFLPPANLVVDAEGSGN